MIKIQHTNVERFIATPLTSHQLEAYPGNGSVVLYIYRLADMWQWREKSVKLWIANEW